MYLLFIRRKLWRPLLHGLNVSRWFHDIESLPYIGRDYVFTAPSFTMRPALNDPWTCSNITRSLLWGNAAKAVILTLVVASARSSVPTEHPGKISSGPTTLFGVLGITGHTICRTLVIWVLWLPGLVSAKYWSTYYRIWIHHKSTGNFIIFFTLGVLLTLQLAHIIWHFSRTRSLIITTRVQSPHPWWYSCR